MLVVLVYTHYTHVCAYLFYNRYYIFDTHILYNMHIINATKINLKMKKRVVIYALHILTFTCQRVRIVYRVIKFNFGYYLSIFF